MSKESRKAELEEQYKKHLQEIEESEDEDDNDDDDIIILRGNARKAFIKQMKDAGIDLEEAKDVAEEVEGEVPGPKGDGAEEGEREEEETDGGKKPKETKKEKEVKKDDPKPPSRHRYFGGYGG